jgi:hypothetical protein
MHERSLGEILLEKERRRDVMWRSEKGTATFQISARLD